MPQTTARSDKPEPAVPLVVLSRKPAFLPTGNDVAATLAGEGLSSSSSSSTEGEEEFDNGSGASMTETDPSLSSDDDDNNQEGVNDDDRLIHDPEPAEENAVPAGGGTSDNNSDTERIEAANTLMVLNGFGSSANQQVVKSKRSRQIVSADEQRPIDLHHKSHDEVRQKKELCLDLNLPPPDDDGTKAYMHNDPVQPAAQVGDPVGKVKALLIPDLNLPPPDDDEEMKTSMHNDPVQPAAQVGDKVVKMKAPFILDLNLPPPVDDDEMAGGKHLYMHNNSMNSLISSEFIQPAAQIGGAVKEFVHILS